jgi:hypothetical protein
VETQNPQEVISNLQRKKKKYKEHQKYMIREAK